MRNTVLLAAIALLQLVLAAPALAAEAIVPPGNSAAAQYTEAFPTAAGERDAESEKQKRSPQKVLGKHESKKLESKGSEGKAVAEIVAETSPAPDAVPAGGSATPPSQSGGSPPSSNGDGEGEGKGSDGAGAGGGPPAGGGGSGTGGASPGTGGGAQQGGAAQPSDSSGLGEVLGQATGASDSGKLGLFLPLILLGAVVWAILFAWKRRQAQRVA